MDPEAPDPDERLRPALEALAEADPALGRAYAACGLPPVRRADPGFAGIVNIVASQQLSKDAAGAIVRRIRQRLDPVTPDGFLALDEAEATALGLSRPKVRYLRGVAQAVASGELDFAQLQAADDATAMERLTALKGIGTWTAEIYLLFALERPDVFPAQDLALQVSAQRIHALDARPDAKTLRTLAETWRPYRSAAAKFLWHAYRHPGAAV
jgi:DNA-3-methyladenine glycosylase II